MPAIVVMFAYIYSQATPGMAVTLLEIARIFATKVPGKIDADVLQLLWKVSFYTILITVTLFCQLGLSIHALCLEMEEERSMSINTLTLQLETSTVDLLKGGGLELSFLVLSGM